MNDKPKRIRGRMPAEIICTVRFIPTTTWTYGQLVAEARADIAARKAKAVTQ